MTADRMILFISCSQQQTNHNVKFASGMTNNAVMGNIDVKPTCK